MLWSGDLGHLGGGFHPLRTVYKIIAKNNIDQYHLQTYDFLDLDGTLTLEKIQLFQLNFTSDWPTSYLQLDTNLKIFNNCCMLILSPIQPFVCYCGLFLDLLNSTGIQMSELIGIEPARPDQFLRSIQLLTSVYWQYTTTPRPEQERILPAPDFTQLLNVLNFQS